MARPRDKREKENTLKACIPYLVPAHLSKQINVCHMTYSRLFHVSEKFRGFLSQLWRRELTLQSDTNRAVCLRFDN